MIRAPSRRVRFLPAGKAGYFLQKTINSYNPDVTRLM
jgi:hypothetical protein